MTKDDRWESVMKSGLKNIYFILLIYILAALLGMGLGMFFHNKAQANIFSQGSTRHSANLMGARIGYKIQVSGGDATWQGAATTWQGGAVTW